MEPSKPFLQSETIKAALKGLILNLLTLVTVFTGKTFDISVIQTACDLGVDQIVNALSIYYYMRSIKGRIEATKTIERGDL